MGFIINKEKTDSRIAEVSRDFLAYVSMLYYKEGLMQTEIAQRINVSRASVVNYLKMAKDYGIVDIRIEGKSFTASVTSKQLRDKYKLEDVYLADMPDENSPQDSSFQVQLARVGATALYDLVTPNAKIGLGWGEVLAHLSADIPRANMPDVRVYQLLGATFTVLEEMSCESCAMRVATRLNAKFRALHAPAVLSDASLVDAIVHEPTIKSGLEQIDKLDIAVFSIEDADNIERLVKGGIHSHADIENYWQKGAVGAIAGRFFNSSGDAIVAENDARIIGADLAQIRRTPTKLMIAGGQDNLNAIAAALRGGFATHLVIDRKTAEKLL